MKLSELLEAAPELRPIYKILKPHLKAKPEEIEVHPIEELEKRGYDITKIYGMAFPPNRLYFCKIPPWKNLFAYELIHLCDKPDTAVDEEIYGYNVADIVVFAAEKSMTDTDPLKLFSFREEDIEKVLLEFGFGSIEAFYNTLGVIPPTHELDITSGETKLVKVEKYSEQDRVIFFINEIANGKDFKPICRDILTRLLELTKEA